MESAPDNCEQLPMRVAFLDNGYRTARATRKIAAGEDLGVFGGRIVEYQDKFTLCVGGPDENGCDIHVLNSGTLVTSEWPNE
jgi:hypothetical protein